MDTYAFLILSILLMIFWVVIFILRKNLRNEMLLAGLFGALAGPISEYWYYKDYWNPPTVFQNWMIHGEDVLFGFALMGISAVIYDVVFRTKNNNKNPSYWYVFIILFILGLAGLIIGTNFFQINSILTSSIIFIITTSVIVAIRNDLFFPALLSGLLLVLLIIPIYIILFNYMFPQYWQQYWQLYETPLGIMILGNIPLTEIIWYFSVGTLLGVGREFFWGEEKQKKQLLTKSSLP